jgi:hypothetical protein
MSAIPTQIRLIRNIEADLAEALHSLTKGNTAEARVCLDILVKEARALHEVLKRLAIAEQPR